MESFDKKNENPNPNIITGGKFEGASAGPDSLVPIIEEIDTQFSEEQLIQLKNFKSIVSEKFKNSPNVMETQDKIFDFVNRLKEKYDEKRLLTCAYYHILIGSTLDLKKITRLDLVEGDIKNFVDSGFFETE